MTEGGIAQWKKKEGESFAAGDVLLEIVRLSALHHFRMLNPTRRRRTRPPSTSRRRMTVFSPKLSFVVFQCCTPSTR